MSDKTIGQLPDGGSIQANDKFIVSRSGQNYSVLGAPIVGTATAISGLLANSSAQESEIRVLQAGLAAVQSNGTDSATVTALQSNVATLQSGIPTLQSGFTSLLANATAQESEIRALQAADANLWANAASQASAISTLSATVANLQANPSTGGSTDVSGIQASITGLQANAVAQQTLLTGLAANITGLGVDTLAALDAQRADINALQAANGTGPGSADAYTALQNSLTALQANAVSQESEIAALQSSLTSINTSVTSLQGNATNQQTAIGSLNTSVTALQANAAAQESEISALQGANASLSALVASKASTLSPNFSGVVTAPTIILTGSGSTGDISLMSVQRESNANVMSLRTKVGEVISVAEYAAADNTISQAALNALVARAKAESKPIFIPGGTWRTSGTLTIDHSADTGFAIASPRSNIIGAGAASTYWIYTGTDAAFRLLGGSQDQGQEAHQTISGMSLVGAKFDGVIGIDLSHIAWLRLNDMFITDFDKGLNGVDVEYLRAFQTEVRFNKRAATFTSRANDPNQTADPTSSDPNSHSWIACTIGNNSEYGLFYTRPSSLSFVGCDIQYNGLGAPDGNVATAPRPGFGIKVVNPATQGGVGINISGGYIEGNAGVADIWLRHDYPIFAPTSTAVFEIAGTGFTRVNSNPTYRSTNFIALDFVAGVGPFNLRFAAAFKNFNGIAATSQAVGFIGAQQRSDVLLDMSGSVFTSGETVDEYVAFTPAVTRPDSTGGFASVSTAMFRKNWNTVSIQGRVQVMSYGQGGTAKIRVTLPYAVRSGTINPPASVVDVNNGTVIAGVILAGTNVLLLTITPADGRDIHFSAEYSV